MTPNQLRSDIQNAMDLLSNKGVSLISQPINIERNDNIARITWKQTSITNAKPYHFGTIDQYISIIKDSSFTCVLLDASLLRLSYTFERNELIAHNLWYYPCPFDIPLAELLVDPLLDVVETYLDGGTDKWRMKGPMRFDFDLKKADSLFHPASHVHFQHEFSRIPVRMPLSPGRFLKFIFWNFYQNLLSRYSFLIEWPEDSYNQTIHPDQEKLIHFSWR